MATEDIRLTFGALMIGCMISIAFSGMASVQAYMYHRKYKNRDTTGLKSTILTVWILDLIHTIFICQGLWHYLVLNWGNVDELDHLTWTVALSIAITGLLTIVVHGFFANRLWRLSKRNVWLTSLICLLAIIRLGSAFATTVEMLRLKHFSTFVHDFRWLFTLGLALSAIIDVLITLSLCFYLQGGLNGYSSIDSVIHRLLLYTINNGLLTSMASVLAMICVIALPHTFLFLSLHFIIAKCYLNSLLATLNSRTSSTPSEKDSFPMAVCIEVESTTDRPQFYKKRLPSGDTRSLASSKVGARRDRPPTPLAYFSIDETVKARPVSDDLKAAPSILNAVTHRQSHPYAQVQSYGQSQISPSPVVSNTSQVVLTQLPSDRSEKTPMKEEGGPIVPPKF